MPIDKLKKGAMALLIIAIVFWALGQFKILYIAGLSAIALGGAMLLTAFYMLKLKQKLWGILIMAFGLFNLVIAGIQIYGAVQ
ncbi:MAG: hypothetical protein GXW99_08170 [Clostridiales bacterium]|nr:hypothetical protein [Clostridiales bacterium]